jgi:dethiobiotin synthetase
MSHTGEVVFSVSDLARLAKASVLLVAKNQLGVLNHVQLTAEAIRADGLTLSGLILNQIQVQPNSISEKTNAEDCRRLLDVPVVSCPYITSFQPDQFSQIGRELWDGLQGS